jgi:hypothetical protein
VLTNQQYKSTCRGPSSGLKHAIQIKLNVNAIVIGGCVCNIINYYLGYFCKNCLKLVKFRFVGSYQTIDMCIFGHIYLPICIPYVYDFHRFLLKSACIQIYLYQNFCPRSKYERQRSLNRRVVR